MRTLLLLLSKLPLRWLHAIGAACGWLVFRVSNTYRTRLESHAQLASISPEALKRSIAEAGKMIWELPKLWFGQGVAITWDGLEHIEQAHAQGKGIVFLTPHLGCFEITAQAYAHQFAHTGRELTVLYRPAKKAWMADIVASARLRPGLQVAPATLAGVKTLVKALRNGQALGILPDQVPPAGLGVWAPFFGQPAYTMTLPAKLVAQTGARLMLAWGERLPRGAGYRIHVQAFESPLPDDAVAASTMINQAMERLIKECPEQYLWGYARYKSPAGVARPQEQGP